MSQVSKKSYLMKPWGY